MTELATSSAVTGGVGLLERAIAYALGGLHALTAADLSRPTPCRHWDLRALLDHLNDSLVVLHEAVDTRRVEPHPPGGAPEERLGDPAACPVAALRGRAARLLGGWAGASDGGPISVADRRLTPAVVSCVGAVEVAVHGWDVARALGRPRPIPAALAGELLELAPLLVTRADRPERFAAPVPTGPSARPGDRLVAFLGRVP